ncbi:MAG: hydantoinase B/oxoprolinase family protein [Chloroflexi bacterium]|nr:hydantoinase B/oxoprolinase family protein [Chloroflexota bacterium]
MNDSSGDAVAREIIGHFVESVADEMIATLVRAAHSPNIKERADCSAGVLDASGQAVALATNGPVHLGSLLALIPALIERFPVETLVPGDAFLVNDPYTGGGSHLNDLTVVAPVFAGELVAFVANIGHHSDVGGRVPGSEAGDSTSIYQDGLRLPPMKLREAGAVREDIVELVQLNSRTPAERLGDLRAQLAACDAGRRRLGELFQRYGRDAVVGSLEELLDHGERRARAAFARLRPGTYEATDFLDEDGISDQPVPLSVRVDVADRDLHLDLSRCGRQLATGKNVPLVGLLATAYYVVKAMVDPSLPTNAGFFRTLRITAPSGSVVNARPPAAVGSRNLTCQILAEALVAALSLANPDRAIAGSGIYHGIILSGVDPRTGAYFVDYDNFAGGSGAGRDADGLDSVHVHLTNTSNLPVEAFEIEYPFVVERYELRPDSGGAGRRRGGRGVRRDLRVLGKDVKLALRSVRQRFPAPGRAGGAPGAPGEVVLYRDGTAKPLGSTFSELPLEQGDVLSIRTPGGGGFGPPGDRGDGDA